MERRRGDAEALSTLGNSRIIDRLQVNAMIFEEGVGDPFASHRLTNDQGRNVTRIVEKRQPRAFETHLNRPDIAGVHSSFLLRDHKMVDRGERTRSDSGRQSRREDEGRRKTADRIYCEGIAGYIAADDTGPFGERALNNVDAITDTLAF